MHAPRRHTAGSSAHPSSCGGWAGAHLHIHRRVLLLLQQRLHPLLLDFVLQAGGLVAEVRVLTSPAQPSFRRRIEAVAARAFALAPSSSDQHPPAASAGCPARCAAPPRCALRPAAGLHQCREDGWIRQHWRVQHTGRSAGSRGSSSKQAPGNAASAPCSQRTLGHACARLFGTARGGGNKQNGMRAVPCTGGPDSRQGRWMATHSCAPACSRHAPFCQQRRRPAAQLGIRDQLARRRRGARDGRTHVVGHRGNLAAQQADGEAAARAPALHAAVVAAVVAAARRLLLLARGTARPLALPSLRPVVHGLGCRRCAGHCRRRWRLAAAGGGQGGGSGNCWLRQAGRRDQTE